MKPKLPRKYWTPAEELELKRLVDLRKSPTEIAEKLGRTPDAINVRKAKLGLITGLSVRNPAVVAQLVKFKMLGWTQDEIGDVFGVTGAYISLLLNTAGFKRFCWSYRRPQAKRRVWTEVEIHLLRKYVNLGYSDAHIQTELPYRTLSAIEGKRLQITKHWLPKAERERRKRYRRWWRNRETICFEG